MTDRDFEQAANGRRSPFSAPFARGRRANRRLSAVTRFVSSHCLGSTGEFSAQSRLVFGERTITANTAFSARPFVGQISVFSQPYGECANPHAA